LLLLFILIIIHFIAFAFTFTHAKHQPTQFILWKTTGKTTTKKYEIGIKKAS